jgi:O-antigen/teichoic acid export membrane protein
MLLVTITSHFCNGAEHGCGVGEDATVVAIIALVVAGIVYGVLRLIWWRWKRGPFGKILRYLVARKR